MKKLYQWVVIGVVGIVILYLVVKKGAILATAGGGGGTSGSSISEGSMLQQAALKCLKMGGTPEQCGQMVFPL